MLSNAPCDLCVVWFTQLDDISSNSPVTFNPVLYKDIATYAKEVLYCAC